MKNELTIIHISERLIMLPCSGYFSWFNLRRELTKLQRHKIQSQYTSFSPRRVDMVDSTRRSAQQRKIAEPRIFLLSRSERSTFAWGSEVTSSLATHMPRLLIGFGADTSWPVYSEATIRVLGARDVLCQRNLLQDREYSRPIDSRDRVAVNEVVLCWARVVASPFHPLAQRGSVSYNARPRAAVKLYVAFMITMEHLNTVKLDRRCICYTHALCDKTKMKKRRVFGANITRSCSESQKKHKEVSRFVNEASFISLHFCFNQFFKSLTYLLSCTTFLTFSDLFVSAQLCCFRGINN